MPGAPCHRRTVPGGNVGRTSKLTPAVEAAIAQAVGAGTPLKYAAGYAGIGERTLHTWLERGLSDETDDAPYRRFRQSVHRAQARSVTALVATIADAARGGDWRAAAWLVTRRAPEEFVNPEKRHDMVAGEQRARLVAEESADKIRYLENRRKRRTAAGE